MPAEKRKTYKLKMLPPLAIYSKKIASLFHKVPTDAAHELDMMRKVLMKARLRMNKYDPKRSFAHATPLADVDSDDMEEFFSQVALLMERQPTLHARKKVISLLLELSSIELPCRFGEVTRPFGYLALHQLSELMPSVIDLGRVFLDCFDDDDHYIDILAGMSQSHLMQILPVFQGLVEQERNPGLNIECHRILDTLQNLFENILNKQLAFMEEDKALESTGAVTGQTDGVDEKGKESAVIEKEDEYDPSLDPIQRVNTLRILLRFFDNIAAEKQPAAVLHERKFTHLLYTNLHQVNNALASHPATTPIQRLSCPYRLLGTLSYTHPEAALYSAGRGPNNDYYLLGLMIRKFLALPIKPEQNPETENLPIIYSNYLHLLTGMLMNCPMAATKLMEKGEMKIEFPRKLFDIANAYCVVEPYLTQTAMTAILLISTTKDNLLRPFQRSMERSVPIGEMIQRICKKLLSCSKNKHNLQPCKDSLALALDIISHYNSIEKISNQLNEENVPGHDREDILFAIQLAKENDEFLDDNLKLKAAECMSTVSLEEFSDKEIRQLVTMLSILPGVVPNEIYRMFSRLIFLLFKIAMDYSYDEEETDDELGSFDSCGEIFRAIYSTEVVSTMYSIISKSLTGDQNSLKSDRSKANFQLSCIKFLQCAWKSTEIRVRTKEKATIDMLWGSLLNEEKTIRAFSEEISYKLANSICTACGEYFQPSDAMVARGNTANCPSCTEKMVGKELNDRASDVMYFFLFAEQTYVGYDITAMFKSLQHLNGATIVSFRVFHQIANIIEEQNNALILERLCNATQFSRWNSELSGLSFIQLDLIEKKPWVDRVADMNKRLERQGFEILNCDDISDIKELVMVLADIEVEYSLDQYKLKKTERPEYFEEILKISKNDGRVVNLVMKNADTDEIIAFICGGPLLKKNAYVEQNGQALVCEVYEIGCRTTAGPFSKLRILQNLLSKFSHNMFQIGFDRCLAYTHKDEKPLFSKAKWANHELFLANLELLNDNKNKLFLYSWDLDENIWEDTDNFQQMVDEDGIIQMIDFLTKDLEQKDMARHVKHEMEIFGSTLTREFHQEQEQSKGRSVYVAPLPDPVEEIDFENFTVLLQDQFLKHHGKSREITDPLYNTFVIGTAEETFLKNVSSHVSLNPNVHTEPDDNPLVNPKPKRMKSHESNAQKKVSEEDAVFDAEYQEQEAILTKIHAWLMDPQTQSCTAAMFRSIYILLTTCTSSLRQDLLDSLRKRETLSKLATLVSSFHFGVRTSVAAMEADEFFISEKFLLIIEELLDFEYKDKANLAARSLNQLELYECILQICIDISVHLLKLLQSRNLNIKDALHLVRSILPYEERLLCAVCRVLSIVLRRVATLTFFRGGSSWIAYGNKKCREKAVELLYASNSVLTNCLFSFLLYDTEHKHDAEINGSGRHHHHHQNKAENDKQLEQVQHLSMMRVHLLNIIGQLFVVNKKYKYSFLESYTTAAIKADLPMRLALLSSIIQIGGSCTFREMLNQCLKQAEVFHAGESMLEFAFALRSVCHNAEIPGYTLLVVTDRCYYISKYTITNEQVAQCYEEEAEVVKEIILYNFVDLEEMEFVDVKELYLCQSQQMLAIRHYQEKDITRLKKPILEETGQILLMRTLGQTPRIAELLSRKCRDDLNRMCPIGKDVFSPLCFSALYEHSCFDKDTTTKLFTYVDIIEDGTDSVFPRLLIWATGHDDYINHILVIEYDSSKWTPWAGSKELSTSDKPLGDEFIIGINNYDLDHVLSIDFSDGQSPDMECKFNEGHFTIKFVCDNARQTWRALLEDHLSKQHESWTTSLTASSHTHRMIL